MTETPVEIAAAPGERRCFDCGHVGSDWDWSETEAWCSNCDQKVPNPVEDVCPECHYEGSMNVACPECGAHYVNVEGDPLAEDIVYRNVIP